LVYAALAVLLAVAAAEVALAAAWSPRYFTIGIPLFARRVERASGLADVSLEDLERVSATVAARGFLFRRLDAGTIAFRENGLQYLPLMRGVIRHDAAEPAVVVRGLVNWFFVALVIVLLVMLRRSIVVVLPAMLGVVAVLYFIQAVRFWRVGSKLVTR
jgi:hypothetical protein